MKLIFDVLRFALVGLALFFVTATMLAGGSLLFESGKDAVEAAQCSIDECLESINERKAERDAANRRLKNALKERDDWRDSLNTQIERSKGQVDRIQRDIAQRGEQAAAMLREHAELFGQLNIPSSFEGWEHERAYERRNELFVNVCSRGSTWSSTRCTAVLKEASVTPDTGANLPSMTHETWALRVKNALRETCGRGIRRSTGNWLAKTFVPPASCSTQSDIVKRELSLIITFLNGAERYQQNKIETERLTARRDALDYSGANLDETERRESAVLDAQREYSLTQAQLDREEEQLQNILSNPMNRARYWRDKYWHFVAPWLWRAIILVLAMYLWRPLVYFTIAPLIGYAGRIRLLEDTPPLKVLQCDAAGAESVIEALTPPARVKVTGDLRKQIIALAADEKLWVRPEYVVSSRGGGAQWIYGGWKHPFTSYAAGLTTMTVFDGSKRGQQRRITIAGTGEAYANAYVVRIELENHPGFVIRPRHVVGFQGKLRLRTQWRFTPVAILRGQVRYVLAEGSGSIYVVGFGGAFPNVPDSRVSLPDDALTPQDRANTHTSRPPFDQLQDALIIGWDGRLSVGLERNENWMHVALLQRDAMFESSVRGEGIYVTTNSVQSRSRDTAGRFFEAILGAIGKILGV